MSATLMGLALNMPLPSAETAYLVTLANASNDDGTSCYPGYKSIVHQSGLSRASVSKFSRMFELMSYLKVETRLGKGKGKSTNNYILTLPDEIARKWRNTPTEVTARIKASHSLAKQITELAIKYENQENKGKNNREDRVKVSPKAMLDLYQKHIKEFTGELPFKSSLVNHPSSLVTSKSSLVNREEFTGEPKPSVLTISKEPSVNHTPKSPKGSDVGKQDSSALQNELTNLAKPKFNGTSQELAEKFIIANSNLTPEQMIKLFVLEHELDNSVAESPEDTGVVAVVDLYHSILPDNPKIIKITDPRKTSISARSKDEFKAGISDWKSFFEKVSDSNFLTGKTGSFKATLDWLCKPSNTLKVLEGNYDNLSSPEIPHYSECYADDEDSWTTEVNIYRGMSDKQIQDHQDRFPHLIPK